MLEEEMKSYVSGYLVHHGQDGVVEETLGLAVPPESDLNCPQVQAVQQLREATIRIYQYAVYTVYVPRLLQLMKLCH